MAACHKDAGVIWRGFTSQIWHNLSTKIIRCSNKLYTTEKQEFMIFYILTKSESPNVGFKSTFTIEWRLDLRVQNKIVKTGSYCRRWIKVIWITGGGNKEKQMDLRRIFKKRLVGLADELYDKRRPLSTWWDYDAMCEREKSWRKKFVVGVLVGPEWARMKRSGHVWFVIPLATRWR